MLRCALIALGTVLLGIAIPWLTTTGANTSMMAGGLGAGMSVFPIVLASVGVGLVATGLAPQTGTR